MRSLRQSISAVVALLLLTSGLPVFSPQDGNRDMRVDLEDAILHIKDLVHSADTPGEFILETRKAISTLHVLAGITTDLRPGNETKSREFQPNIERAYLLPSPNSLPRLNTCSIIGQQLSLYQSVVIVPDTPPPRA